MVNISCMFLEEVWDLQVLLFDEVCKHYPHIFLIITVVKKLERVALMTSTLLPWLRNEKWLRDRWISIVIFPLYSPFLIVFLYPMFAPVVWSYLHATARAYSSSHFVRFLHLIMLLPFDHIPIWIYLIDLIWYMYFKLIMKRKFVSEWISECVLECLKCCCCQYLWGSHARHSMNQRHDTWWQLSLLGISESPWMQVA